MVALRTVEPKGAFTNSMVLVIVHPVTIEHVLETALMGMRLPIVAMRSINTPVSMGKLLSMMRVVISCKIKKAEATHGMEKTAC